MDENESQNPTEPGGDSNPYAPTSVADTADAKNGSVGLKPLSWEYTTVLVVFIVAFAFLSAFIPGLAIPALMSVIAGAVRVPIMRQRLSKLHPRTPLPNEFVQLIVSSVFAFIGGIVSIVAFMVVCIPGGIILSSTTTLGSGTDIEFVVLLALSAGIGVFSFVALFLLSLKLPV